MKEYKVVKAKNAEHAEQLMNEYAAQGWRVVNTMLWSNWTLFILITFERDR